MGFYAALKASGLDRILNDPLVGPITVFAPSDTAFAALPKGTLGNLLKPENKAQLVDLLKYHVIGGQTGVLGLRVGCAQREVPCYFQDLENLEGGSLPTLL